MSKKKPEKVQRYLSELYRATAYYPSDKDSPAYYHLQIFDGLQWIGSYRGETMEAILDAVRASDVEIVGDTYPDYLMPRNALENVMQDEILELRKIVSESVRLVDLQRMGYDVDEANAILKRCEDHTLDVAE